MSKFNQVRVLEIIPYGVKNYKEANFFLLRLEHPVAEDGTPLWNKWKPGQFAMLRPTDWNLDLPWARPLSICDVFPDSLLFFFQVTGRGTSRMRDLREGNLLHIWGPLGNGFEVKPDTPTIALAGGAGLIPFAGYARAHPRPENLRIFFSHRPPKTFYPLELFDNIKIEDRPENSVQDRDNYLTELDSLIKDLALQSGLILACGPKPFLAFVQKKALEYSCKAQLSVENRMVCGVGACLACVVAPTTLHPVGGKNMLPVRSCVNGPVFWADHIKLD